MTARESEMLANIFRLYDEMTDFQRGVLIGYGEAIAAQEAESNDGDKP